jgi:hypothetical protein
MSFNAGAFGIAAAAIAIFGVALYIWDTRKDKVSSSFTGNAESSSSDSSLVGIPGYTNGGSRRRRRGKNKKLTKRR